VPGATGGGHVDSLGLSVGLGSLTATDGSLVGKVVVVAWATRRCCRAIAIELGTLGATVSRPAGLLVSLLRR
jgi:hypothetical protein